MGGGAFVNVGGCGAVEEGAGSYGGVNGLEGWVGVGPVEGGAPGGGEEKGEEEDEG